jgi:hypothetical protein
MGSNGIERGWSNAFAIGNYGYIGLGLDSTGAYLNTYWQYYPCSDTLLAVNNINANTTGSVSLFPNPSNGLVHFSYKDVPASRSEMRILDVMGRVIKSIDVQGYQGMTEIDMGGCANGIYFYQFISGSNIITGKIVLVK